MSFPTSAETVTARTAPPAPCVVLRAPREAATGWLAFAQPVEVLETEHAEEVPTLLRRAEAAAGEGLWTAGFITYGAAPGFDPALVARRADGPLAWLGLFRPPATLDADPASPTSCRLSSWRPSVAWPDYERTIGSIRSSIARGDVYQVNYTLRLAARLEGDPWGLFSMLWRSQRGHSTAYVDTGERVLCSASPELFFRLDGRSIVSRPMKGTARRGLTTEDDERLAEALRRSPKDRAENLMIVDMVRNDLGRIARPGSVRVPRLFELEKYDSLYQLTSTVEAETEAGLAEIFGALFPCASITGAPKIRATELISELETSPRGPYTGAIGFSAPGRRARFSVAIRTVEIDRRRSTATYGTGGGIVWDSEAEREYRECRTKALVLTRERPEFELLETLRREPDGRYPLLAGHLDRMARSARYFDFPFDRAEASRRLDAAPADPRGVAQRVRLRLDAAGELRIEVAPASAGRKVRSVGLAAAPIDRDDRFLYHKTTWRRPYERALAERPDCDDVLLWNRAGELTESTIANLVVRLGGRDFTPPVTSGLLAGVRRAELLAAGVIEERVLPKELLAEAEAIDLINSVRGRFPVRLVEEAEPGDGEEAT